MERALQAILLLAVLTGWAAAQWHKQDRVLLREVNAITLHKGMMTNARRAAPVPQLRCVGGDACGVDLRVAQCENKGWDGRDVQWECKADLSNDYRFGDLAVNCEGYDYPDDPYILAGSCGLEYELTYTEQGQRNRYKHGYHQPYSAPSNDYGSRWSEYTNRWSDYTNRWTDTMSSWWRHPGDSWRSWWHRPWGHTYAAGPSYSSYSNSHGETTIWSVIVMAVVCFFILRACLHSFNIPAHYNIRPLFGHHATPHHNTGPGYYGGVGPAPGCDPATGAPTTGGPGFWTGLGVGGLLGNWWSRRRGTQYATRPVTPPPAYHAPNYRETTRTTSTDADHTGTRTASGFGGTRRR